MALKIEMFAALQDNYGFLITDEASGHTAMIDAPEPAAMLRVLDGRKLDFILNTHWHPDHAGGNALMKARTGCLIYGPGEVRRIAPLDHELTPGDVFHLGETELQVLDLGGHTLGHVGYDSPSDGVAFVGDTLFPLGCGRLFEGTPEQMWASLTRIIALPGATKLYSAHEYTLASLSFAESLGGDDALKARGDYMRKLREQALPTVPATVAEELATNPFLVWPLKERDVAAQAKKFGELRAVKDRF
jgi:hydroxyacylglutathione hydrolase